MVTMDDESLKQQELAEKKKRRLERNRASARECRKRKKEKKLQLRAQLARLEADNLQLRLKLQVGKEAAETNIDKSVIITTKLTEMINEGAGESEIISKLQELKERFSDYGRDRRSAIDFHINQVRRCLQPTQTTKAILWIMSLAPKFQQIIESGLPVPPESQELFSLWTNLLSEVHPDEDQRKLIVSYTTAQETGVDPFEEIDQVTDDCNNIIDRIVEIIYNKINSFDIEMNTIQSILSPRQIAKFILWIDQNPACMQMLEALWPHLTYSIDSSYSASSSTPRTGSSGGNGYGHASLSSRTGSIQTGMSAMADQDYDSADDSSDSG